MFLSHEIGGFLTLFRMRLFEAAHGCGLKNVPLPLCYTHPSMMKLVTVISYLEKVQRNVQIS